MVKYLKIIGAALLTGVFGSLFAMYNKNDLSFWQFASCLIIVILLILGVIIVPSIYNHFRRNSLENNNYKNAKKYEELLNSLFFNMVRASVRYTIPEIHLKSKPKEEVLKKFLTIYFRTFYDFFYENYRSNNPFKLNETTEVFYSLFDEIKDKAIEAGIPEIFVNKFTKFNEPIVKNTFVEVQEIVSSVVFSREIQKHAVILLILNNQLMLTLSRSIELFDGINGDLQRILCKHCVILGVEKICEDGCIYELTNEEKNLYLKNFKSDLIKDITKHTIHFQGKNNETNFIYYVSYKIISYISFIFELKDRNDNLEYAKMLALNHKDKILFEGKTRFGKKFLDQYEILKNQFFTFKDVEDLLKELFDKTTAEKDKYILLDKSKKFVHSYIMLMATILKELEKEKK